MREAPGREQVCEDHVPYNQRLLVTSTITYTAARRGADGARRPRPTCPRHWSGLRRPGIPTSTWTARSSAPTGWPPPAPTARTYGGPASTSTAAGKCRSSPPRTAGRSRSPRSARAASTMSPAPHARPGRGPEPAHCHPGHPDPDRRRPRERRRRLPQPGQEAHGR